MDKFMTLAALALGLGCSDKDGDSTGESDADTDADTDTDTDTDPNVPTNIQIDWSANSVDVTVTDGTGNLTFGITQTGKTPWEAEDGVGGMTSGFGPFYHIVGADDTTTLGCVSVPEDVTDSTSLFCDVVDTNGGDDSLTYYIATSDDLWCAVAGQDISYYSTYGCDDWNP